MIGLSLRLMRTALIAALASSLSAAAGASAPPSPLTPDISPARPWRQPGQDYELREAMIPMRDGVRLYTIIIIPSGAQQAPILLTRTPFNASGRMIGRGAAHVADLLAPNEAPFLADGYIRVFQDVRGKNRSEGEYVVARPARGPLNASDVDHATDAYDTIAWLVSQVPQSNGRVGMIGSSYDGLTAAMALLDPHPALKAVAAENPMLDGWMGDDWFHHGAFRQITFDFIGALLTAKGFGPPLTRLEADDYTAFLRAGSASGVAEAAGLDEHPFWRKLSQHPAYDGYWQGQALDQLLASKPLSVPTLWVGALWDQEDPWGAVHGYSALETKDARNDMNFLVLGPWRHGGMTGDGSALGPLKFDGDTALEYRLEMLKPFLDGHLKTDAPKASLAPVSAFETGANQWRTLQSWPAGCVKECSGKPARLYLRAGGRLAFDPPTDGENTADHYVSDPANPVPYVARPISGEDPIQWRSWLSGDQSFVAGRPDVLTYVTPQLTSTVRVRGAPVVNLFASTSGSDADWVVKVIDVYPDPSSSSAAGGKQVMVSAEIFRGRYRQSFDKGVAIKPGKIERYRFALPNLSHAFLPGHRIMVQVQSSWFPLYDRNPQTFVDNIFFAPPEAYRAATQSIAHSRAHPSAIELPLVSPSEPIAAGHAAGSTLSRAGTSQ